MSLLERIREALTEEKSFAALDGFVKDILLRDIRDQLHGSIGHFLEGLVHLRAIELKRGNKLRNYELAEASFAQALENNQSDGVLLYFRAKALSYLQRSPNEKENAFQDAMEALEDYAPLLIMLGQHYAFLGNAHRGHEFYTRGKTILGERDLDRIHHKSYGKDIQLVANYLSPKYISSEPVDLLAVDVGH